jgi:hypothetical protein
MVENMEDLEKIDFTVGEKYENEKGPFEVISITGDKMVIKWDSGEEISSTVELQRRIQERRLWEKMAPERKAAAAAKSRRGSRRSVKKLFEGLQDGDFQNKISRTKWRNREQLGGNVTIRLMTSMLNFNSWASRGQNEVHWADTNHWRSKQISSPAKFFARANEEAFMYGFHIERPETKDKASADWEALLKWLHDEKNEQWLRELAIEEGLEVFDTLKLCFSDVIKPAEKEWTIEGSAPGGSTATLAAYLDACKKDVSLDLVIAKHIPKDEAIAREGGIVDDIINLLGVLLPIYNAASDHLE